MNTIDKLKDVLLTELLADESFAAMTEQDQRAVKAIVAEPLTFNDKVDQLDDLAVVGDFLDRYHQLANQSLPAAEFVIGGTAQLVAQTCQVLAQALRDRELRFMAKHASAIYTTYLIISKLNKDAKQQHKNGKHENHTLALSLHDFASMQVLSELQFAGGVNVAEHLTKFFGLLNPVGLGQRSAQQDLASLSSIIEQIRSMLAPKEQTVNTVDAFDAANEAGDAEQPQQEH